MGVGDWRKVGSGPFPTAEGCLHYSVKYLTPDAIIDYIRSNSLYRDVHHQDGLQQAQLEGGSQ